MSTTFLVYGSLLCAALLPWFFARAIKTNNDWGWLSGCSIACVFLAYSFIGFSFL